MNRKSESTRRQYCSTVAFGAIAGIGEAVGCLVSFALQKKETPHAIRSKKQLLADFQQFIRKQGVETEWARV